MAYYGPPPVYPSAPPTSGLSSYAVPALAVGGLALGGWWIFSSLSPSNLIQGAGNLANKGVSAAGDIATTTVGVIGDTATEVLKQSGNITNQLGNAGVDVVRELARVPGQLIGGILGGLFGK